ncbi:MAG: methyltransferase domain-containing protein [Nitrospira sp.]|nr:methyltransferase domain-containing protein [Nitrospira sp.]
MRYVQEQEEWNQFIQDSLGEKCVLVNISSISSDCRVYKTTDAIFKIRRLTPASIRGRNNCLEDEYLVLKHLSSVTGVPKVRSYKRIGQWEQLEMELLPELYGYDPTFGRPQETCKDFWDVARVTLRMNRLGCSHGDLHWCNVGKNIRGGVSVFDFDQACMEHPLRCVLRDMFGFGTCEKRSKVSLWDRLQGVRIIGLLLRAMVKLSRQLVNFILRTGSSSLQQNQRLKVALTQRVRLQADPGLELLAEAWNIASLAKASSPGVDIAYYSIDISGVNFPGERPWLLRWERIRKNIDFKGKRLLELGCNMGLLSIHAKLSGASACLGIDVDREILEAANLASRAFGTEVIYRQFDLADSSPWEEELNGFDVISALSVLHWIENKERVWSFIGKHKEMLYEGHESEQEAESNLRRAGFTKIVRLGLTERNRQMFYASQE